MDIQKFCSTCYTTYWEDENIESDVCINCENDSEEIGIDEDVDELKKEIESW